MSSPSTSCPRRAWRSLGQTFEGKGDGSPFLARHQVVSRRLRWRQVDQSVLVAPVTVLRLPHGGHHVARSDYRVRLQHAGLNSSGCGEYPHESLLHQIVDGGRVLHACTDMRRTVGISVATASCASAPLSD